MVVQCVTNEIHGFLFCRCSPKKRKCHVQMPHLMYCFHFLYLVLVWLVAAAAAVAGVVSFSLLRVSCARAHTVFVGSKYGVCDEPTR